MRFTCLEPTQLGLTMETILETISGTKPQDRDGQIWSGTWEQHLATLPEYGECLVSKLLTYVVGLITLCNRVHIEGEQNPQFDNNGYVVATDGAGTLISDLRKFLDVCQQYGVFVNLVSSWNKMMGTQGLLRVRTYWSGVMEWSTDEATMVQGSFLWWFQTSIVHWQCSDTYGRGVERSSCSWRLGGA